MTTPANLLPVLDEAPDVFVDSHDILANPTPEEIERGEALGRSINVNDHRDRSGSLVVPRLVVPRTVSAGVLQLRQAMLDHGAGRVVSPYTGKVGGVSIEIQAGAGSGGGRKIARLHHHTAGATISSTRLTPSLFIVKNGRTDLSPPLCNGYGGGDFVYRIITELTDWANHPGLGGPFAFSQGTVPENNGRPYLWGTEWDWNGVDQWPDEYLHWMACCDAGLADFFGLTISDQAEHKNWAPLRKIDRNIITRSSSIAYTTKVYNDSGEDPDVPNTKEEIQTWVNECLEHKLGLGSGEDMALAVYGQTSNKQFMNRTTATNNPSSIASMVASLVQSVSALTTIVVNMKTDLSDDEANIVADAKKNSDAILAAVAASNQPPA